MFSTERSGFTLGELLGAILLVAVACVVALPAIPADALSEPIEDLGPVDIRAFRLEFASEADRGAVEQDLRSILPLDDPEQPGLCEVAARDLEPRVVYVGLWMPAAMSADSALRAFECLSVQPVRVTELERQ